MESSAIKITFILISLINFLSSYAQFQPTPGSKWYTLTTPHFFIHYPKGYEDKADYYAKLMEDIDNQLTYVFKYRPLIRTNIVLIDNWDILYGGASNSFFNTIWVNPVQIPVGLGHYNDFHYNVLLHEYVHILDIDMVSGIPEYVRKIFGRIYSPNQFSPNWMIEGYATYHETRLTPGGRGKDPYYDMYLRMAFLDNKVKGVSRFDPVYDQWPIYDVPYIFGESLYSHLESINSMEKVIELRKLNSRKLIPFYFKGRMNWYWKGKFKDFYKGWKQDRYGHYSQQLAEIEKNGLTPYKQLTNSGEQIWGLEWSVDDDEIYFIHESFDRHQSLMQYSFNTGIAEPLTNVNCLYSGLQLDKTSNQLVFNQYEVFNKNSVFSYTSCFDPGTKQMISRPLPERSLYSCKDTKGALYYIRMEKEQTILCRKDEDGLESILIEGNDTLFLFNPAVSPDNRYIAFEKWEKGGKKDIWIYDLENNMQKNLTDDRAWDITPSWSPDGNTVIFSSDRSGVYNLYSADITTNEIRRLTNVVSGAFFPKISNNGDKIAFLSYSSAGFDLSVMDFPDLENLPEPNENVSELFHNVMIEKEPAITNPQKNNFNVVKSAYNPFRDFMYPIRSPYLSAYDTSLEAGIQLLGTDALGRHSYYALLYYDLTMEHFSYSMQYQNSAFYPDILISAEDIIRPVWVNNDSQGEDSLYRIRSKVYSAGLVAAIPKIDHYFAASLFYSWNKNENLFRNESLPDRYITMPFSHLNFGLQYSSAKGYKRSISIEEGFNITTNLQYSLYDPAEINNMVRADLSFDKYFSIPGTKHHVFYAHLDGSFTNEDIYQEHFTYTDSLRCYGSFEWDKKKFGGLVEYRLPLLNIERGIGLSPVYFRKIFATVFSDYLKFNTGLSYREIGTYGAEIHMAFKFFYYLPVIFSTGYCDSWHGNLPERNSPLYFKLNLSLLLE